MDLQRINSKIQWPQVTSDQEEQLTTLLGDILAPLEHISDPSEIPDMFEHVTVGFNSAMAAIETPEKPLLAVFICKTVLGPSLAQLFELPSAALGFKLIQLPAHPSLKRANGVIGVRKSLNNAQIESLVSEIENTKSSWVYEPASFAKRERNPARALKDPKDPKAPKGPKGALSS